MPMAVEKVVFLTGDVDFETIDGWSAAINEALVDEPSLLALDMGAVSFIDSKGLSMLLAARARCHDRSAAIELRHVPASVDRLLHMTGLDLVFADGRP